MKKAFTMVEVMIVIAIIGLLAAIAIPSFVRAKRTHELTESGALLPGESYDLVLDQKGFYEARLRSLQNKDYGTLGSNDTLAGISTTMEARFIKTKYNDGWFVLRDFKTGSQWVGWEVNEEPKFLSPFMTLKPVPPEAPDN